MNKIKRLILTIGVIVSALAHVSALTIKDLTINSQRNPQCVDCQDLTFGWKIDAPQRGTYQKAYEITVYSDAACSNKVWSSGKVDSDASANVTYTGLPIAPESRYYWRVNVSDNTGANVTSAEKSYFDTGLMGDWSGAKWIKPTDRLCPPYGWTHTWQTLEADVTIISGQPSIVFGWSTHRNFFQLQLITTDPSGLTLRRGVRTSSDDTVYDDVPVTKFKAEQILNTEHRWRIDITESKIVTYIDDTCIDEYDCPIRRVPVGKIGFGAGGSGHGMDDAYYDNVRLTYRYPDDSKTVALEEDFEGDESLHFLDADIVSYGSSRKCHVCGSGDESMILNVDNEIPTFYTQINLNVPVTSVKLYTSSIGVYDIWVNSVRAGHRTDDGNMLYDEMKPGWTDYRKRVTYSVHDITNLCHTGKNLIGVTITPGWSYGSIGRGCYLNIDQALMGKIVITYADGLKQTIVTDNEWLCTKYGHLMRSDIYDGVYYDARRQYPWETDMDIWPFQVEETKYDGEVVAMNDHVRALEHLSLKPKQITVYCGVKDGADYGEVNVVKRYDGAHTVTLNKGETVIYDFGQNQAGVPRLTVKGASGTRLHARFAEMLNDSGLLERGNDGPKGSIYTTILRVAKSEAYYILAGNGRGETYMPYSTYYGYRYCEITATDDIEIVALEAVPWSSSYNDTGAVTTDNDRVNQLFSNIVWGQRSNLLSVPTDCPQRNERLGWTGDTQLFCNTAMYNADLSSFYRKWLTDMRDGQREDGAYSNVAPISLKYFGDGAWADAGIIVPWYVYMFTGNAEVIRENYESMNRYMVWLEQQHTDGCQYAGGGTSYGDWLAYSEIETDKRYVSQAYYANDAMLMSKMSAVLSDTEDDEYDMAAQRYMTLFGLIRDEMQSRYFGPTGLKQPTQTACVLALCFGLCANDSQKECVKDQLAGLIANNDYCLDTGFLGTGHLNTTLSDNGLDNLAYTLLMQGKFPSWLYSVDNGATTMWERWDSYTYERGFGKASMNSFNHYAYGAIGEWMYRNMAGIAPCEEAPGFKKTVFAPSPDLRKQIPAGQERMRHASARYESMHGGISSEWTIDDDDELTYSISLPANTTGEVRLPVLGDDTVYYEGDVEAYKADGVSYIGIEDGRVVYTVESGQYTFRSAHANRLDDLKYEAKVYPNPVHDTLYIDAPVQVTSATLYSMSGQAVCQWTHCGDCIDVRSVAPGCYMLKLECADGMAVCRVVKR